MTWTTGPLGMYHVTKTCTWIEVTQLRLVCGQTMDLGWHTAEDEREDVVIQEDQDGDLGLRQLRLIYTMGPTLKWSPNMKPTTTILGTLLQES